MVAICDWNQGKWNTDGKPTQLNCISFEIISQKEDKYGEGVSGRPRKTNALEGNTFTSTEN